MNQLNPSMDAETFADVAEVQKPFIETDATRRDGLGTMSRERWETLIGQFKELGDIDITKEPMEVGPTTHYMMGGIKVDADSQMTTVPGLFAAGECAAG